MFKKLAIGLTAFSVMWAAGIAAAPAQDAGPMNTDATTADSQSLAVDEALSRNEVRSLDENVQDLKKEVLDLNRDLFLLEEELLFPANSQVAFFISLDVGEYFDLDSVNLKIDGK